MGQKGFGNRHAGHGGGLAIVLLAAALGGGVTGAARAAQVIDGEQLDVRIDSTIAAGVSIRAAERRNGLVYRNNGGYNGDPAFSSFDNGDLNYDQGDVTSVAAKLTVDAEVVYDEPAQYLKQVGAFVRMNAFYDVMQNCEFCTRRTPLGPEARHRSSVVEGGVVGTQFRLLDAYAFGTIDVAGTPVDLRFGNQVISWGESLFIPGGINQINGFDVAKYRSPGSEIKEALVPAPAVRVSSQIVENLGFEAYYQFAWFRTQVDPVGSFFSTNDLIGRGARGLYVNSGVLTPGTGDEGSATPSPLFVRRAGEDTPSDQGQAGAALRYYWDAIETEFGAYFLRYHSKTPALGFNGYAMSGAFAVNPDTGYGVGISPVHPFTLATGYYVEQYAEGVHMAGLSFSTEILGAAVAGEISYRPDDAVQISAPGTPTTAPLGSLVFGDGYEREKRVQAQASTIINLSGSTRLIGPVVGFTQVDDMQFIAEASVVSYPDLAPICPLKGAPPAGCIFYAAGPGRIADPTSFGYQMMLQGNWANPVDVPITLTPRFSFMHDAVGDSPGQFPFIEDRMAVSLGLKVDYQQTWTFDVSYTNSFGAGQANLNGDRDFVAGSLSYSF